MKKFVYCMCVLCAAAFCFSACQKDELEDNLDNGGVSDVREYPQPQAGFLYHLNASFFVSFQNESYNAASYLWDFGDGTTSTSVNPEHTYASKGLKRVTLTAYNGNKSDKFSVVLDMTGYITLQNASSYPFIVCIDGTQVGVLKGKADCTLEVTPGTHKVYVEQQSGYLLYPTTRTYNATCYPGDKTSCIYTFNTVLN